MRNRAALLLVCLWPVPSAGQEAPLSAIDWLSNSIESPSTDAAPPRPGSALPETISVRPLDHPVPDSVGLLSPTEAGLPADLWSGSGAADVAARLAKMTPPELGAMQSLLRDMLILRAAPPKGSAAGEGFFLARLDTLLAHGRFDAARSLMERAGYDRPEIFRRWFDLALLSGREDRACQRMRALPEITPTYPARIFCLARSGDWRAAAVTLETARALEVVTDAETARLTRFLDEFAGGVQLPPPETPTPLDYLLYEAIGEPLRSPSLPLPFAHADLRHHIGWKAQIAAAERLARSGAIDDATLAETYGMRAPAASGEPWDRITAWQGLAAALEAGEAAAVSDRLPGFWREMRAADLLSAAARWAGPRLARLDLADGAPDAAGDIALLSGRWTGPDLAARDDLPARIVTGRMGGSSGRTGPVGAVIAGLTDAEPPAGAADLFAKGRAGEALLSAIELIEQGAAGSLDALRDGLAILERAGLETRARAAAIEVLLTEPRS